MEDLEVKIILILQLSMTNKSLNDNYKGEESKIQKFEVGALRASTESTYVFAQS